MTINRREHLSDHTRLVSTSVVGPALHSQAGILLANLSGRKKFKDLFTCHCQGALPSLQRFLTEVEMLLDGLRRQTRNGRRVASIAWDTANIIIIAVGDVFPCTYYGPRLSKYPMNTRLLPLRLPCGLSRWPYRTPRALETRFE